MKSRTRSIGALTLPFAACVALGGCQRDHQRQPATGAGSEASPSAQVATKHFTPEPIEITIEELPEPFHSESARKNPRVVDIPDDATLYAPPGFRVSVFADDLDQPRWLAMTPEGDVLVTETRAQRIRLLRDTDGDGAADERSIFADESAGLNLPFGMAFRDIEATDSPDDFTFYLGNTNEVRSYPYVRGERRLVPDTGARVVELPGEGYHQHWTRNVILSPDGSKLFVSIGSESNVSPEESPRASVQVIDLTAAEPALETFAYGLRNPVGLDFHPVTGALYATVNERDGIGDDLVPDYLARLERGQFYGWPYAYLSPGNIDPRLMTNDRSDRPELAAQTVTPEILFQAHSAALGLTFYDTGRPMFPERYRNGAFVAFRGSWNRDRGTGYKIAFVPFDPSTNRPTGAYEDFITGFLLDPGGPTVWGRPVGVLMLPDGSLIFTEEPNGRIYRVSYTGP